MTPHEFNAAATRMGAQVQEAKPVSNPPRPYCLEEPCIAWSGRVCGHEVLFGRGACLLDDPERAAARVERLKRKAMRGKK